MITRRSMLALTSSPAAMAVAGLGGAAARRFNERMIASSRRASWRERMDDGMVRLLNRARRHRVYRT